ncbi:uncharacterized protein LOC130933807 [Arachis stenosperma]|uniref:uncharacterized protein LOC130933807 n=1 Tax=Arachis stenosperma TaxID=217475 RepID=UPI0025AC35F3|nr:uncharacterized protein LOC130933807 [Arachis stenosperma]
MNKVFADYIGKIMEVYVDDMLIKTQSEETLLSDLAQVFDTIRKHDMRLNPVKCTFAVEADLAGRILQWAVELSEFGFQYEARTAIKSQYLADFIAEFTDALETLTEWNLYVDGSSNKTGSGAGVIIESNQGTQVELSLKFGFPALNNQAEYEALLAGLKLAEEVGAKKLNIYSDSQVSRHK